MSSRTLIRLAFVASVGLLAWFVGLVVWEHFTRSATEPLIVQAAASLRPALDEIAAAYEKETGGKVELRFAGSQTILTNLEVTGQGDLFIPADESYLEIAGKKDLLAEVIPLAKMRLVVLVRKDFPGTIKTFDDLLGPNVKLAQTNPDAGAVGKLTRDHFTASGKWDSLKQRTTVFTGNVVEAGNAVKIGSVDAALVWDVTADQFPEHKKISLPELDPVTAKVQLAVVKSCTRPTEALRFARFVAASDRGLRTFQTKGFRAIDKGDKFEHTPELVLYGGSMLRPAVEETIKKFEQREGVRVKTIYNGCGILVTQMNAGEKPDIYFACDTQFMKAVQDRFDEPAVISSNQLVIAVKKGNPHDVIKLRDLGKDGLRVGVGHEQQCALGAITKETFLQSGTYKAVMKNVVVQSATGDFLINQLRTGSLDAVVAYQSNANPYDDIEAISVTGIPCAAPLQPVAVSKTTNYPNLTYRLLQSFQTAESRDRFKSFGFGWQWKGPSR